MYLQGAVQLLAFIGQKNTWFSTMNEDPNWALNNTGQEEAPARDGRFSISAR